MRPRIIPVLLLNDRGLYKTTKFKDAKYIGDPINAIKLFNDLEVDELIIVDTHASKNKSVPDFEMLRDMATESFMPMAYGGGITSVGQGVEIFSIGYEKLTVNVSALHNLDLITKLVEIAGSSSVVAAVDIKSNFFGKRGIYNHATRKIDSFEIIEYLKQLQDAGAGEIFLNSVDRDGIMQGYDCELYEALTHNLSVPIIACGGAGKISDMKAVIDAGAHAAAAGSLFVYHGKQKGVLINYPSQEQLDNLFDAN